MLLTQGGNNMIYFESKGDFKKTNSFLEKMLEVVNLGVLDKYGRMGVEALKAYTPIDTGRLKDSWYYEIEHNKGSSSITWSNSDIEGGCNVAILIQYGHATKNGGYVQGFDFINPAMKPVFDKIADSAWKEVTGQ